MVSDENTLTQSNLGKDGLFHFTAVRSEPFAEEDQGRDSREELKERPRKNTGLTGSGPAASSHINQDRQVAPPAAGWAFHISH